MVGLAAVAVEGSGVARVILMVGHAMGGGGASPGHFSQHGIG